MIDAQMTAQRVNTIWIDLDNSPHVPFFKPIIVELEKRGYSIVLTARDCFQVCELADLLGLDYKQVGRHYGKHRILKVAGLCLRALQLLPTALRKRPLLALSHGSRAQMLAALALRIPSISIDDYEHSREITDPTWMIMPEVVPAQSVKAGKHGVFRYPGIKEDVYVPSFQPDLHLRESLGLDASDLVVTMRPPATEAHYHNAVSEELFEACVDLIARTPGARMVVLPRSDRQRQLIEGRWASWFGDRKIIIPKKVVDGLSLIWHSDLVISGGGTMNREAAALGVPVYSIFRGTIGAVDRYLCAGGRLTLLESLHDVRQKLALVRRRKLTTPRPATSTTLDAIVDIIDGLGGETLARKTAGAL